MSNKNEKGLAIIGSNATMSAHAKLSQELAALKAVQTTSFKTGGSITLKGETVDLTKQTSIGKLIELAGNILTYKTVYGLGAEALGLEEYPEAKLSGQSLDAILHDIELQTKMVTYEDRKKKIEKALSKLSNYFTKEDKLAQDLAEIQADLGIDLTPAASDSN